jgi:DinB superfamily
MLSAEVFMKLDRSSRPEAGEHPPYFERYTKLVPAGDVVETLARQSDEMLALLRPLSEEKAGHRYAPGKWSIKDLVGHVTDTERVFGYRALAIARGDQGSLPGFDENVYAEMARFDRLPFTDLLSGFDVVRQSSLTLLRQLDAEAWGRVGTANGHATSVRAMAFIMAGHARHHENILRERYL